MLTGTLARLHQGVIVVQRPRREILVNWEDKPGVTRRVVEQFFELNRLTHLRRDQRLHLRYTALFGLAEG